MPRARRLSISLLSLLLGAAALGGCSSQQQQQQQLTSTITVNDYTAAFDATKKVLRENGFAIDRQDARAGIITTRPKTTGGIATPWDREQSSLGEEIDDTFNRHARIVRVRFGSRATGVGGAESVDVDIRTQPSPITVTVAVSLLRRERPGWRVESTAINLSTYSSDPAFVRRGLEPSYVVVVSTDDALAARLADEISMQAAAMPPALSPPSVAGVPEPTPAALPTPTPQ